MVLPSSNSLKGLELVQNEIEKTFPRVFINIIFESDSLRIKFYVLCLVNVLEADN